LRLLNKNLNLICITVLTLLWTSSSSAAIYKCKTATGETVYSSKKCEGSAENFTLQKDNNTDQLSENNTLKPSVDIYITSWCPYCKKAMAYLRSNNISFNTYNIETDKRAKLRKQKLAPGYAGVPLTVINGKILKGFTSSRFDKMLNL